MRVYEKEKEIACHFTISLIPSKHACMRAKSLAQTLHTNRVVILLVNKHAMVDVRVFCITHTWHDHSHPHTSNPNGLRLDSRKNAGLGEMLRHQTCHFIIGHCHCFGCVVDVTNGGMGNEIIHLKSTSGVVLLGHHRTCTGPRAPKKRARCQMRPKFVLHSGRSPPPCL